MPRYAVIKVGAREGEKGRCRGAKIVKDVYVRKRRRRRRKLRPLKPSTVQDKSLDVMLLLTNGIARNSALSYEHVRDVRFLSRGYAHPPVLVSSTGRQPRYPARPSVALLLVLYLSRRNARRSRRDYVWCFTTAEVAMTVLSRPEFLATCLSPRRKERLLFAGHSAAVDETETFVSRS